MPGLDSVPAWWGFRHPPARRHSILELVDAGTLDVDLAALLWLLVEHGVPVIVAAAPPMAGKTTLLTAILDFAPPWASLRLLTGLSIDREEIGPVASSPDYLLAPELSDHTPAYVWGTGARRLVRAAADGHGLATTMHGSRLEDVFEQLGWPPVGLGADELSHLGVVIVLGVVRGLDGWQRRVLAAHYVRPVARDAGGHVQRRGPAVLVAWDPRDDSFGHFEWGIADELAGRVGLRPGDFESERERRAAYLRACIDRRLTGLDATLEAIRGYGRGGGSHLDGRPVVG